MMKKILLLILLSLFIVLPAEAGTWCDSTDCQACWLMDVDEDPIRDSSQNSNTGALFAAGKPNYTASGKFGGGYDFEFDTTNDFILVTDNNSIDLAITDFTIVVYTKRENVDDNQYIVDKAVGAGNGYQIFFDSNDLLRFRIDAGTGAVDSGDTAHTDTTQFHHHAIAADRSGNAQWYYDGTPDGTLNISGEAGDISNSENLYVGADEAGFDNSLDGIMDEIAIFSTLLDSTDINNILDNGLGSQVPSGLRRRIIFIQ